MYSLNLFFVRASFRKLTLHFSNLGQCNVTPPLNPLTLAFYNYWISFTKYQEKAVVFTRLTREINICRTYAMPKKDKTSKSAQKQPEPPSGPVSRDKSGAVAIAIHAKAGSKQNAITDVSAEAVGVAIAAPPTDGEANAELVRYLSKVLDIKKSEISLDKGCRSRGKVIKVFGSLSPEEILERLKREATG